MKTEQVALIKEARNGLSSHCAKILRKTGYEVVIAAKGISSAIEYVTNGPKATVSKTINLSFLKI